MKIVLKLQFLTCKKYSEHRSTAKNCNFSKLQFFKCTFTVIPLHIFAVWCQISHRKVKIFISHDILICIGFRTRCFVKECFHKKPKPNFFKNFSTHHKSLFFNLYMLLFFHQKQFKWFVLYEFVRKRIFFCENIW